VGGAENAEVEGEHVLVVLLRGIGGINVGASGITSSKEERSPE